MTILESVRRNRCSRRLGRSAGPHSIATAVRPWIKEDKQWLSAEGAALVEGFPRINAGPAGLEFRLKAIHGLTAVAIECCACGA